MRISSVETDPGYGLGWGAQVLLDGIEQIYVETADEELGMVVKAALDETGHIFTRDDNPDEVARETLYGKVEIRLKEAA